MLDLKDKKHDNDEYAHLTKKINQMNQISFIFTE